MSKKRTNFFLMIFAKITGVIPALIFFKTQVFYMDKSVQSLKLPKSCILMSNHKKLLDFVLYIFLFYFRNIRFLMAEVLFGKSKILTWLLKGLGGIYVNRDLYNMDFVTHSLETLDRGGCVGIFPQGRLPVNGKDFPYKPGIVYIALRTDAPIIPVYTDGNYGLFKRTHVMVGTPIDIRNYCVADSIENEDVERLAAILQEENYKLKTELEKRLNKNG